MRHYKVEITHRDDIVYACEIWAATPDVAVDLAWAAFDPGDSLGELQTDYSGTVEEI